MSETYYTKRGRRYIAVAEYDGDLMSALPKGSHLVTVTPGCRSTVSCVDPANVAVLAVIERNRNELCRVLLKASEMKPMRSPITEKQRAAWDALSKAFGTDMATLHVDSASAIIDALKDAIVKEVTP